MGSVKERLAEIRVREQKRENRKRLVNRLSKITVLLGLVLALSWWSYDTGVLQKYTSIFIHQIGQLGFSDQKVVRMEITKTNIVAENVRVTPVATARLVVAPTQTARPTSTPSMWVKVKTGYDRGSLNLRDGPGLGNSVLATLKEGDRLKFCSCAPGGWLAVKFYQDEDWVYGYVYTQYVEPEMCP